MTRALKEAFGEASRLAEEEQDSLAAAIRAEIEAETAWESALASSADAVAELADEAIAEHRAGRTRAFGSDEV
jgi:hypothetical protein